MAEQISDDRDHGDGCGDVLDSWEELEDTGVLNKKLKEIKVNDVQLSSKTVIPETNDRTPYQPQVKILKRRSEESSPVSPDQRSQNKPLKTLEQREAEYAEARRRIMGAGYVPPEEDEEAPVSQDTRPPRLIQKDGLSNNIGSNSVQIVRQPRGPDGSPGFEGFESNR